MAISKQYTEFHLECDECGELVSPFDTFQDALDYAKDRGWKIRRGGGEWWMECDECKG